MIFIIGIIGSVGIIWQLRIIRMDDYNDSSIGAFFDELFEDPSDAFNYLPKRLWLPMVLGSFFLVGTIIWGVIVGFVDDESTVESGVIFNIIFKVLVLFVLFNAKSFFGPIISCFVACVAIYNYFEYSEIGTIALIQPLIDWVFGYFPDWMQMAYWIVLLFNLSVGSIADSFES